jgi:hypothetical protein
MNMVHPFMPDLSGKSLDDIIKEMNDISMEMRSVRNGGLLEQMRMVLTGYQAEYRKRMNEEMERKPKKKDKEK